MANYANIGTNAIAADNLRNRDPSPELRERSCWGGFLCLGTRKREKKIVPTSCSQVGSASSSRVWESNGSSHSETNQVIELSPSLLAPPSSPTSYSNSLNVSSVQSPAHFALSLSITSANDCVSDERSFDSTAMMFTIGPYAHETALVTPPAFSAFTTAPSTAPFTPPPELVQFTTPSSPDVPFSELLLASLHEKSTSNNATVSYPASALTSPDQRASIGLVSCDMEYTIHTSAAITFENKPLYFPALKLDASEIDAAYVASILLSQASMAYSSPSRNPQLNEQQVINKGRLSFGFDYGLSSLLADQQADIGYLKLQERDTHLEDDIVIGKNQSELVKPICLESNV